jgi:hypothetical protein
VIPFRCTAALSLFHKSKNAGEATMRRRWTGPEEQDVGGDEENKKMERGPRE